MILFAFFVHFSFVRADVVESNPSDSLLVDAEKAIEKSPEPSKVPAVEKSEKKEEVKGTVVVDPASIAKLVAAPVVGAEQLNKSLDDERTPTEVEVLFEVNFLFDIIKNGLFSLVLIKSNTSFLFLNRVRMKVNRLAKLCDLLDIIRHCQNQLDIIQLCHQELSLPNGP